MVRSARPSAPPRRRLRLRVELLEDRTVPSSFTPAQIRHAYGFDQITASNGKPLGDGQTIAVVDAYDDPTIAADLALFGTQFGLPAASLVKATPQGLPPVDAGWAGEIALDVEWAHAVAPGADILLVEARSASLGDLLGAVDYARSQPGVSVVSMSWGANEFSTETSYDFHFTSPSGHAGVTFVASSGDSGTPPEWPAISPNVLSVGGTSLSLNADSTWKSETGWSGSGGGKSVYELKPTYQTYVSTPSSTKRTNPDVAYDANPNTGFQVIDSQNGGLYVVGGTSAGAPQWAALVAAANQSRVLAGQATLDGPSQTLYAVYAAAQSSYSTYYHDVTSGRNGSRAGPGYDTVTGLGTPIAKNVVSALVAWTGNGSVGHLTVTQSPPAGGGGHATRSAVRATADSAVAAAAPVAPPTPTPVAPAAAAVPPALPVAVPVAPPVLAPALPTTVPPVAGDIAVSLSAASPVAAPAAVPMAAPARPADGWFLPSATDGATDGPGLWDWLFDTPAVAPKADEPASPEPAPADGGGGGDAGDVEVSGVSVDE